MSIIAQRINALRQQLKEHQLAAYLVPSSDPHQSEYVAEHWSARQWLSGFTGSAGTLIVTTGEADLWTDSRYFLQGEQELSGSGIVLQKQKVPHAPEHLQWLRDNLPEGSRLGFDGQVVSLAQSRSLAKAIESKSISLVGEHDFLDAIWPDRPPLPATAIIALDASLTGASRKDKLRQLRAWLEEKEVDSILLIALDEVAWTLNIRARDVDFNPVCISYLHVSRTAAQWFVGKERVSNELEKELTADGIDILAYTAVVETLRSLPAEHRLAIDPNAISYQMAKALTVLTTKELSSPIQAMKGAKNATEIANTKQAMRKDGVALLRLFRWLEQALASGAKVTEASLGTQLTAFRAEQPDYFGNSFPPIVGYRGNGAIVHYRADEENSATIKPEGILLLDSGGQYLDGTTDITRTVALGPVTAEQKRHYTLVLKGMIALSCVQFPKGISGANLDVLARQFLWQDGLNYGHGTGHGVGAFLNVHEGPQGISTTIAGKTRTPFVPGMITSNEPGFYRTDHYGIRIENLILCVASTNTEYGHFLRFETLSLFPIDVQLVDRGLLSEQEVSWLNAYHQRVYEELVPLLTEEECLWLQERCRTI